MHNPDGCGGVVLLGSGSLQIQSGLTESLAGRFELTRMAGVNYPDAGGPPTTLPRTQPQRGMTKRLFSRILAGAGYFANCRKYPTNCQI